MARIPDVKGALNLRQGAMRRQSRAPSLLTKPRQMKHYQPEKAQNPPAAGQKSPSTPLVEKREPRARLPHTGPPG